MHTKKSLLAGMLTLCLSMTLLAGCGDKKPEEEKPMPGSDRDEHGCIGSAGYVWDEGQGRVCPTLGRRGRR
jgi:hypothetical protein